MTATFETLTDEELAGHCAEGVDEAERTLLRRYMPAIYGLPQQQFGAEEEDLSEFLIYAVEKVRERHLLGRYDPEAGASFRTWFGVVIRNLYFDFLRRHARDPALVAVGEEGMDLLGAAGAEPPSGAATPEVEAADRLLGRMELKCRALFKLLLANAFFLSPDELRWVAETSGRDTVEAARQLAELEEDLRETDVAIEERHRQLERVYWWQRTYERQLCELEQERGRPEAERQDLLEKTCQRLQRRREQHRRLVDELAGSAGVATAPYRRLAEILRMKEGTLGSHLSRCRQRLATQIQRDAVPPETEE